jgi:hypothetical protein
LANERSTRLTSICRYRCSATQDILIFNLEAVVSILRKHRGITCWSLDQDIAIRSTIVDVEQTWYARLEWRFQLTDKIDECVKAGVW